jgi:4'-phosphopantetheinyl transferase
MTFDIISGFVRCDFRPEEKQISHNILSTAEVFFGHTRDFRSKSLLSLECLNKDDQLKANKVRDSEDKITLLTCYTMLRMIISKRLKINPLDISFETGTNGKPRIKNDSLFFNISHTSNSYAFALSEYFSIGVDLEELNEHLNYEPIIKRFFSRKECEFILESKRNSRNRFFLLWTRKEALLKAIGTGIVSHLSHIEVSDPINFINRNLIEDFVNVPVANQYYIYSRKLHNNYLSVALPQKTKLILYHLDENSINTHMQ